MLSMIVCVKKSVKHNNKESINARRKLIIDFCARYLFLKSFLGQKFIKGKQINVSGIIVKRGIREQAYENSPKLSTFKNLIEKNINKKVKELCKALFVIQSPAEKSIAS